MAYVRHGGHRRDEMGIESTAGVVASASGLGASWTTVAAGTGIAAGFAASVFTLTKASESREQESWVGIPRGARLEGMPKDANSPFKMKVVGMSADGSELQVRVRTTASYDDPASEHSATVTGWNGRSVDRLEASRTTYGDQELMLHGAVRDVSRSERSRDLKAAIAIGGGAAALGAAALGTAAVLTRAGASSAMAPRLAALGAGILGVPLAIGAGAVVGGFAEAGSILKDGTVGRITDGFPD